MTIIREEIYKFFADYIFQQSGMVYSHNDYYRLDARINELIKKYSVPCAEDIYKLYKEKITPDMKEALINVATNNETFFFRDVMPFTVLSKDVIKELLSNAKNNPIKIWSAASSTGQEAFSILMSIHDTHGDVGLDKCNVFASDISTEALSKASYGIYNGLDVQRGLPTTLLIKYFSKEENGNWKIKKNILQKINFFEFNLLKDKYPESKYHIVFCRNVLIYQDKENKTLILNNIHEALLPGGYLFMGNGESLIGISTKFESITIDGYTIYKKTNSKLRHNKK